MRLLAVRKNLCIFPWLLTAPWVHAEIVTFAVDVNASSLTSTGESSFGPTPVPHIPQGAGGATVTFSGTIVADVTSTGIRLLAGTQLIAMNGGNYYPKIGGSTPPETATDPANYGYTTAIFSPPIAVAIRGLVFDLETATELPLSAGNFPTAGIAGEVSAGVADINYGRPPQSNLTFTDPFETDGTATGSLSVAGNVQTVTLPLTFTTVFVSALYSESTYTGTITARRTLGLADSDGDGVSDLMESLIDGDSGNPANLGKSFVTTEDTDASGGKELLLTVALPTGFVFPSGSSPSLGATFGGNRIEIQGSTNLANFDAAVSQITPFVAGSQFPAASSGFTYQRFRLEGSEGLPGKGFLRIKANTLP